MTLEPGTRARRVGESVRKEIASIIIHEMKDPKVAGSVVTRVEISNDLRTARVMVRCLESAEDPARRRDLIAALQRASGMLRREVTRRLRLRHAPLLRFVYDEGAEHTNRIEQLLDEIAAERRSR
jgi:ribosome-binding factor A